MSSKLNKFLFNVALLESSDLSLRDCSFCGLDMDVDVKSSTRFAMSFFSFYSLRNLLSKFEKLVSIAGVKVGSLVDILPNIVRLHT